MTGTDPNADPAPPTIEYDFQMVRQRVVDIAKIMNPGDPAGSDIANLDMQVLVRTAQRGVLDVLATHGAQKASTILQEKLEAAAETDDMADLFSTVGAKYRQRAESTRERDETANTKTAQTRMALLAEAAGSTATAIAASVVRPESTGFLLKAGADSIGAYAMAKPNDRVVQVLRGLLNQAEISVQPNDKSV